MMTAFIYMMKYLSPCDLTGKAGFESMWYMGFVNYKILSQGKPKYLSVESKKYFLYESILQLGHNFLDLNIKLCV